MRGEYTRLSTGITGVRELPPRARRIQGKSSSILLSWGTTSACAENTFDCVPLLRAYGNYLRVRGEYTPLIIHPHTHLELPPRARRILGSKPRCSNNAGTTSACAENTSAGDVGGIFGGNYLRVRGEYAAGQPGLSSQTELPPRARRIRQLWCMMVFLVGTTSACAENTVILLFPLLICWNYLRVRGEYPWGRACLFRWRELPPRARRIRFTNVAPFRVFGTTSACAENTGDSIISFYNEKELPPRARRIQDGTDLAPVIPGTTSACAENTGVERSPGHRGKNYLRVRGEY